MISTPPPVPSPFGGERGPASSEHVPAQGHPGGGVETTTRENGLCNCACHDVGGGPFHPGERCVCNGGTGFDDLTDWEVTT